MSLISADDTCERKRVRVLDAEMAYFEKGEGPPIVLLHGNPATSYLWRNVIPHLEGLGRCLAPDLMNSGESDNIPGGGCRYQDHIPYMDAWFEAIGATTDAFFRAPRLGSDAGVQPRCTFPRASGRPRLYGIHGAPASMDRHA